MMRLPLTLSFYISRQIFWRVMMVLGVLMAITWIIDTVELVRRAAEHTGNIPFSIVLEMGLLKQVSMSEKVLPFAVLIGVIVALARLTRTQELVVARGAGVSVWQFLAPALLVVVVIGTIWVAIINPLGSAFALRFDQLENRYLEGRSNWLSISSSGLWMRQIEPQNSGTIAERIIHAERVTQEDMTLFGVVMFGFDAEGSFLERLDAPAAVLLNNAWELQNAARSRPGKPSDTIPLVRIATEITREQIQDSFAAVNTLSFWELAGFIHTLEKAGFSALRHKLYLHALLASPLMLAAMVLLAAIVSLRLPRRGGTGLLFVIGGMIGFLARFLTDIVYAFGMSGSLPVVLAAWAPACIGLFAGVALLLHLEDG